MAANGAPFNSAIPNTIAQANTDAALNFLSVFDPDSAGGVLTTTLNVQHGTISLALNGGAAIGGNGTSTVVLDGTLAQIVAALGIPGNVTYRGLPDFFGTDTLTMTTNDNGNSGTGGPLSDTDHGTITVKPLVSGTPGDDVLKALPGNATVDGQAGIDTIVFDFKLTDAMVSYAGNKVIVNGPSSHTVLSGFEIYKFTDGTVNTNDGSPLIDDLFYYSRNHDVWKAGTDADQHYNQSGWREGRDPSAFFSTTAYLTANPDVKAAGVNPLTHFDTFGWKEGRVSSLNFDPHEYLANYPDVAAAGTDPLSHFLRTGAGEGRMTFAPPGALATVNGFDYVYYLQNNPDVAAAGVDAFQHFQTVGWKEGRDPNAFFDTKGYLANYADVKAANLNPLDHYNQFGWHEGRDPSVAFDTTSYLSAYADIDAAHINPLIHFLHYGMNEGRSAFADGVWG